MKNIYYYNGLFWHTKPNTPEELVKTYKSVLYGTDENGNQAPIKIGENLEISDGKLNVTFSGGGGNVDDVQINSVSVLGVDKIANINLGDGLSFDSSSNTLDIVNVDHEHVIVDLNVNTGSVDFSQYSLTVYYNNDTYTYQLTENGEVEFNIPIGVIYEIKYPKIDGYYDVSKSVYVSELKDRIILKTYQYYGNSIRMVVLEQSNPTQWTTSGSEDVVDYILNMYGTYVIDEINKKYAKLDPSDHTYFEDGSEWNGSYGNSFRHIPEVFYKVETNANNQQVLKVSFHDIGGHSWPDAWIGTYKGSVVNNILRSIPGVMTTQSKTMSDFWTSAQNNGANYGLVNYFHHCMLLGLHYAKFGKSDSTLTMGPGLQDAGPNYYTHQTGYCKVLGDGTGSMPYAGQSFTMNKLFGIEDLAGSTWEFRPNIRFSNNGSLATVYTGNTVSNTASGRTFPKLSTASWVYITRMVLGEYCDFIPSEVGGTSETYYCDSTWASTSGALLRVGGNSNNGTIAGLSAANSNNAFSDSNANNGARLTLKLNDKKHKYIL